MLDLNGCKIGGPSMGLGTRAVGIYAHGRQNITVRNGTVRGYHTAIRLDDYNPYTALQGHVIEDIRADQDTLSGMLIAGKGNIIRNNQIVATGDATTQDTTAFAFGFLVFGPVGRLLNIDVTDDVGQGADSAAGIRGTDAPISIVVGLNRSETITSSGSGRIGVCVFASTDTTVKVNIISGSQDGIFLAAAASA